MNLQRTVFARLYRRAPSVESLPWHREQQPALLERAVAQRTTRGRAPHFDVPLPMGRMRAGVYWFSRPEH